MLGLFSVLNIKIHWFMKCLLFNVKNTESKWKNNQFIFVKKIAHSYAQGLKYPIYVLPITQTNISMYSTYIVFQTYKFSSKTKDKHFAEKNIMKWIFLLINVNKQYDFILSNKHINHKKIKVIDIKSSKPKHEKSKVIKT